MATPSAAALADCLDAADRETVVAFVAALYEARGATVERQPTGDADFVLTDSGEPRRVAVHTDPAAAAPAVETVVSVSGTPPMTDATVRTVADLHDQLRYAIARDRADDLLETHFGRDLASLTDAEPAASDAETAETDGRGTASPAGEGADVDGQVTATPAESGADGDRDGRPDDDRDERPDGDRDGASAQEAASADAAAEPDEAGLRLAREEPVVSGAAPAGTRSGATLVRDGVDGGGAPSGTGSSGVERTTIALGLIAVVVVMAALATGPGVPLGSTLLETVGDGGGATEDATAADEPSLSRASIDVNATMLPPGVDPSGEMDERALAAATRTALENTSYRLTLTYREFRGGEATGVYSEVLRVEDGRRYRTDVRRVGELVRTPPAIAEADRYANGTVSLRQVNDETAVTTGALSPSDPFQDELAQYLRWYLSVEASRITDRTGTGDATTYRIATNGDSYAGVTNTTGSALVTRDGLVWSVRRSYDDPSHRNLRAVVSIRISGVGSTTAPKPDWVE